MSFLGVKCESFGGIDDTRRERVVWFLSLTRVDMRRIYELRYCL